MFHTSSATAQTRVDVELELVLAVDVSTSVDDDEFNLQRVGFAEAFRHPDVLRAIRTVGPNGIAVSMSHWSSTRSQAAIVAWMHVFDTASAERFANAVLQVPRRFKGTTDISGAIDHSVRRLMTNRFIGKRMAIDVSGDGTSDPARDAAARDRAVARGITINGLAIHNEDIDLGELAKLDLTDHYARHVIGGPGSFIMAAADFSDFRRAIRQKLIREILGPNIALYGQSGSAVGQLIE